MKAPHPIVRQIVDRCHVGESCRQVISYVASRLNGGRKGFLKLKRSHRRLIMRDAIRVHTANHKMYRQVMSGNFR